MVAPSFSDTATDETSLAFEKSLESHPMDFYPCDMYLSFSKVF
jgi:hypothetical protein